MVKKREVRLTYLRGLKASMIEHINTTEGGLRALPGLTEKEIEKLISAVHKQHYKLLGRIERQIEHEARSEA